MPEYLAGDKKKADDNFIDPSQLRFMGRQGASTVKKFLWCHTHFVFNK